MVRLQFPEFAQLPIDIQAIILDYICDRRDPIAINAPGREESIVITLEQSLARKEALKRWKELRLVCFNWSEWFSIGAIHFVSGESARIASNQLLECMTSLKSFELYGAVEPEALKKFASMIPSTVQHLKSPSAKLLLYLPRKTVSNLQTINLNSNTPEPQIRQTLKRAFRKFGGRIKSLRISPSLLHDFWKIAEWENVFRDCALEELTLGEYGYQQPVLPLLPATLKRLNVCYTGQTLMESLFPAASNLEVLNASISILTIRSNIPVFSKLKEISVYQIVCSSEYEHAFSNCLPSLEKIYVKYLPSEQITQRLFSLPRLRSIFIEGTYWRDGTYFDLSYLSPQLEEFKYYCNEYETIRGQPQQEMKHLRKLIIYCCNHAFIPKGILEFMPALEELALNSDQCHEEGDYKGVDLGDLLPVCHTLVDLDAEVSANDVSQDVLYKFTRLKRLNLIYHDKEPFVLGRLPQSLEKLRLEEYFTEGNQMGPLPNLKELICWKCSVPLVLGILRNAPNLRKIVMDKLEFDKVQTLLKELEGLKLKRVSELNVGVITELLAETVFQLLQTFPNIELLRIEYQQTKPNNQADKDFPVHFLSFLNGYPSLGNRLEQVVFISRKFGFDKSEKSSKAALQELQNKGIQLEVCAWL